MALNENIVREQDARISKMVHTPTTFTSRAVVDCLNIAFAAYAQMGGN